MAKIDGDSSSSSVPNPSPSPINGDRPPQLKKFRTASGDAAPPAPDSPLFGGPLRPAVRRLTVSVDDPSAAPTVGGLLDRDWCYPSFLGGGATFPSRPRPAARPDPPRPPPAPPKKRMDFSGFSQELRPLNRAAKEKDERDHQEVSASSSSNARAMRGSHQNRRAGNSLILSVGSLLKQLAIANKSLGGGTVVVLAEREKEEMEMDIAKLEFDFMGTSVICRSGSPLILADLKKVSVSKARAIIVLAADENADQSDARALRVVLSLTGVKEGLRGHVVVEMSDLDNEPLVKLVGGELIETVVAHDVIGRLMIQCALQPGLAQIWEDILGFENAEFYIKRWPQLDGMRFEDLLISFPDAVPCGVKVAANGGKIIINPDGDYILKEGDEVLVIAEDDDTYAPGPLPEVRSGFLPNVFSPPKYPEKILFCGWRRDIDDMIMVLEAFLAPGSELWMFNEVPEKERERKLTDGGLDILGLTNITLVHKEGNAVIRRHLESLPLETFDSILILADESAEDSIVHSDSRSLATLLLIRDIQSKRLPSKEANSASLRYTGFSHSSWIREMQQASDKSIIISEILDSRTRNLVSVSRISDYVLSNELVSMALAMVAEDKQINRVLEELFAEQGNEMCIRPAEYYLYEQEELCFYDIMLRGRERREIVIGYRLANADRAIINPTPKLERRKWSIDDVFVVISFGE